MRPDQLMIFAAGFGTRMGELTRTTPKPLIRLGGRPLIDRTIEIARSAGIRHIVANAHYHANRIEAHFAGTDVTVLREEPEILDTGGGLKAAGSELRPGLTFTANPDVYWSGPNPFTELSRKASDVSGAALLLIPQDRAHGHGGTGDFSIAADGMLTRGGPMTYTGIQIIRIEHALAEPATAFSLNTVWNRLIATGQLTGVVYSGEWCDVGSPVGLDRAEGMLPGSQHD